MNSNATILIITTAAFFLMGLTILLSPDSIRRSQFTQRGLALLFFNQKPRSKEEPVELTDKQIYTCGVINIVMGLVGIAFIILLRGQ